MVYEIVGALYIYRYANSIYRFIQWDAVVGHIAKNTRAVELVKG